MNIIRREVCQRGLFRGILTSKYIQGYRILTSSHNYNLSSNNNTQINKAYPQLTMKNFKDFSTRNKRRGGVTEKAKAKFVKPIDVGAFSPKEEAVIQLENGYYLLYYHRQKKYTMFLLYLKYLIPIFGLIYLIRKNPFYKSYPIMLPVMFISLFIVLYKCVRYSGRTNRMIHQILIDPTGTEATFIYKNRFIRKLRNDNLEETFLIQSLQNPPQGNEYVPLKGRLFPQKYPFNFDILGEPFYFWLKYYTSQHNFFTIAKDPVYI